jgi:hypothetical protein
MADSAVAGKLGGASKRRSEPKNVYLVPFPKVVFLYPSFLAALTAGVFLVVYRQFFAGDDTGGPVAAAVSLTFLLVLSANLVVLGFDFPRATWLAVFFFCVSLALGLVLLFTFYPGLVPSIDKILATVQPTANSTFYFIFAGTLGVIFLAVMVAVRFNYWEVRGNELLHHRGLLSDLVRYPTERLKVEKEIADVFEYLLLRSGNLVLFPRDTDRPIVLENVLSINKKEKALAAQLSTIDVKIDNGDD